MNPTLPQPEPPDAAAALLQRETCEDAVESLRDALPPPRGDTPEASARRNRVALAKVLSMVPANPVEADLAASHVIAMAWSREYTRRAGLQPDDLGLTRQLDAQAASRGREARSFIARLESLQAARRKREATDAGRESTAWTVQVVHALMTKAMERLPPAAPPDVPRAPATAADAPATAEATPPPKPVPPRDYSEWSDDEKRLDRIRWEADQYAIHNTMRVQAIRKLGGLPPDCDYEPPPPEVLRAIINLDGPVMRFADTYVPWAPPEP